MTEKRISWEKSLVSQDVVEAYNEDGELLGQVKFERVGAHFHWCWYQESGIRMSPGCLQEVRDKQKGLLKELGS